MHRSYLLVALKLTVVLLLVSSHSPAQSTAPAASDISFTVSMSKPWTHLLEVEMRVRIAANLNVPNETNLVMPVWTPGSYLIREFERHVQDFAADSNGRALDWIKVNKNTWRVQTVGDGDRLLITSVRAGSPAYEQGLNANDQIVALEGARVTKETFEARLAEKKPGDTIRVTVFRFDDLRTFDIRLAGRPNARYRIVAIAEASEEQKRIYQMWMAEVQNLQAQNPQEQNRWR